MVAMSIYGCLSNRNSPKVRVNNIIAYNNNSYFENANSVIQFQSNGLMEAIWKLKLTICLSNGIPL